MPKIQRKTKQIIESVAIQTPTEEVDLSKIANEIFEVGGERKWLIKKRAVIPKRGYDFDVVAIRDVNNKITDIPLIKLKEQLKQLRDGNMLKLYI